MPSLVLYVLSHTLQCHAPPQSVVCYQQAMPEYDRFAILIVHRCFVHCCGVLNSSYAKLYSPGLVLLERYAPHTGLKAQLGLMA